MVLYDKILQIYPELSLQDFDPIIGTIHLQNDAGDDYIKSWDHPTLSQPTVEHLTGE